MIFPKRLIYVSVLLKEQQLLPQIFLRKCADLSIIKTQLEVPTFCDIHVDLACKVRIRPLNVHKYHNSNAFLLQTDQKYDNAIEHYIDGNKVIVKGHDNLNPNTLCSIKAPVKANLHIKARNDVSIGFFQGDKLNIMTEGNIFVDRFQGNSVDISTSDGNITLKNFVQAANILATVKNGSISTGRLQGSNLKLKVVDRGDLSVESSYCTESMFVVEKGNMDLNNIHKNCKIFLMKGNLILTGFDGKLSAVLNSGSADIHLAQITGNSDITLKDKGELSLKLTEACQDLCQFKIISPNVSLADDVKSEVYQNDNDVVLKSDCDTDNVVLVNCSNGKVNISSASWQDMIQMKIKKTIP